MRSTCPSRRHCHSQFLVGGFSARYDGFSNNGLDDEEHLLPGLQAVTGNPAHRGMFKVPSLRNIALTAPYMHDMADLHE